MEGIENSESESEEEMTTEEHEKKKKSRNRPVLRWSTGDCITMKAAKTDLGFKSLEVFRGKYKKMHQRWRTLCRRSFSICRWVFDYGAALLRGTSKQIITNNGYTKCLLLIRL